MKQQEFFCYFLLIEFIHVFVFNSCVGLSNETLTNIGIEYIS